MGGGLGDLFLGLLLRYTRNNALGVIMLQQTSSHEIVLRLSVRDRIFHPFIGEAAMLKGFFNMGQGCPSPGLCACAR